MGSSESVYCLLMKELGTIWTRESRNKIPSYIINTDHDESDVKVQHEPLHHEGY